jgi:hypothetical protein
MWKILVVLSWVISGSLIADSHHPGVQVMEPDAKAPSNQRHMIELNPTDVPSFIVSMSKSKTTGSDSENESDLSLALNYAYTIHPNFQLGARFNYFSGISGNTDIEKLDVQVGGWFNFSGGHIQNSAYLSAHVGTGYAQTFGPGQGRDDLISSTFALGKRFSMDMWGIKHLSWAPEIALTNVNSTTNTIFDYRQATEFRILKFSVIW